MNRRNTMLVYIKPKSIFPDLHSDTLFGAMVSAMADLFPSKVDGMIKDFDSNNPPFILSSAFPFVEVDDKKIRFLPKFSNDEDFSKIDNMDVFKKFKKIEFLQEELALNILKGELSFVEVLNNLDNYHAVGGLLAIDEFPIDKPFKNMIVPNNSVNRFNHSTKIFYSEGKTFDKCSGLFFFIKIFNEDYRMIIESILRFLKDRGFGKDISNGKGQFDYEVEDIDVDDIITIDDANSFITLSRYIPDFQKEKIEKDSNYEIGFKRSISRSFEIRKQVRFFKEGSSFSGERDYYGMIVHTGENAVEYGYAFPLRYCRGGD